MFFIHLIFALFFALIITAMFLAGFKSRSPRVSLFVFFLVIFLTSWAGGAWLTPMGPPMFGAYWLPFLLTALIIGLLIVALAIPGKPGSTVELVDQQAREQEREKAASVLSTFFWVLFALLLVLIAVRYMV